MTTRIVRNVGELTTNDPTLGDGTSLGRLHNAAFVVDDDQVLWVGASADAPDADEMLERAGGVNAVTEGDGYPTLGMERVISLDPDVVLNAAMAEAHGGERITADSPGWSSVRAVKTGHVVGLDDEAVLRPGPRVADGLRTVAHALHPGAALP